METMQPFIKLLKYFMICFKVYINTLSNLKIPIKSFMTNYINVLKFKMVPFIYSVE